jgi:hypothetical protein
MGGYERGAAMPGRAEVPAAVPRQQRLYFFPDPQGHDALREGREAMDGGANAGFAVAT